MSYFYAKVCPEGHYEVTAPKMIQGATCKICGKPLIDKCPECGAYIGRWIVYGMARILPKTSEFRLTGTCPNCGSPYPWADKLKSKEKENE